MTSSNINHNINHNITHKKGICVIPARGGSTRVPRKNIKDLCGRPMIAWVIDVAKNSNLFDRIIVSTEDQEIADVAKKHGAEVPFLRNSAFDNMTHANEAIAVALDQAYDHYKESYDYVGMLFANAPLQTAEDLVQAFNFWQKSGNTSIISAAEYPLSSPWQAMKLNKQTGQGEFLHPEELKKRTQDRQELFALTGAFLIAKYQEFRETREYDIDRIHYPITWINGLDIDNLDDFHLAEFLMSKRLTEKQS